MSVCFCEFFSLWISLFFPSNWQAAQHCVVWFPPQTQRRKLKVVMLKKARGEGNCLKGNKRRL
jgi:hypothetical protein